MPLQDYEIVMGLEVHVELKTNSKIFCGCTTEFGGDQNTHVCPICLGLPGVLPVVNKKVIEYAVKAGLAINGNIANFSKFDRKNYFYPDLPKNFQTSQYDLPIVAGGYIDVEDEGTVKRIGITRIHMEEDAGKLVHQGETISTSDYSNVDYNRTGVPLLEIVSEPDFRNANEVKEYLEKLKAILQYLDVSDCKMEEGSLRCDVNISLRPWGQEQFGTRTELKNMNSFRAVVKAIEYEAERQAQLLDEGDKIIQETRTWDENRGVTLSMRSKEEAHDYRYFPEPDLVPMVIDAAWIQAIRETLPELPDAKRTRYIEVLGLPAYDANVLTLSKAMAEFFDETVKLYANPKAAANWIMVELARLLNASGLEISECKLQPDNLAKMLRLMDEGTISSKIAKVVFEEMFNTGEDPEQIVKEKGLVQISDSGALEEIVVKIIAANPQSVEDYKAGKKQAIGFLVGQIMKETKGKANPGLVNTMLTEKLDS